FQVETKPAFFTPFDEMTQAADALVRGNLDAVIMDSDAVYRFNKGLFRGLLRVIGPSLMETSIRLCVKRGRDKSLIDLCNKGLQELRRSGLYEKMLLYWDLY